MGPTLNWQQDGRLQSEEGPAELSPQQQHPVRPGASLMASREGEQMLGWTVAGAQRGPLPPRYTYHLGASCPHPRLREGGQEMAPSTTIRTPHMLVKTVPSLQPGHPTFHPHGVGTLAHPHTNEKVFLESGNVFLSLAVALSVHFVFLFYMSFVRAINPSGGKAGYSYSSARL